MLKKILFAIGLSLSLTQYANAKPASASSVEKLIKITNTEAEFKKSIQLEEKATYELVNNVIAEQKDNLSPKQLKALNNVNKDMSELFTKFYTWEKIKPEIINVYTQVYSQDEVDAMIKFYEAPLGKSILSKSPLINEKNAEIMEKQMKEISPAFTKILSDAVNSVQ